MTPCQALRRFFAYPFGRREAVRLGETRDDRSARIRRDGPCSRRPNRSELRDGERLQTDALADAVDVVGPQGAVCLQNRQRLRRALVYPPLEILRGLAVGALWPVPFLSSSVAWRGTRYRVGHRTLLVPKG